MARTATPTSSPSVAVTRSGSDHGTRPVGVRPCHRDDRRGHGDRGRGRRAGALGGHDPDPDAGGQDDRTGDPHRQGVQQAAARREPLGTGVSGRCRRLRRRRVGRHRRILSDTGGVVRPTAPRVSTPPGVDGPSLASLPAAECRPRSAPAPGSGRMGAAGPLVGDGDREHAHGKRVA